MAAKQVTDTALQDLKRAIREKEPERFYLFHGEEVFLMRHYLEQLRRIIVDEVTESFNFHGFNTENFDISTFADAVENFPVMTERTMVLVEDVDFYKFPEEDREKIGEILSDIPEYCTVVLIYETVSWHLDAKMKKLSGVLSKAQIVAFEKQSQRDLIAWLTRHFAAFGKKISPNLCIYLIDITDGTMTSLSSEVEKISAYSASDSICKEDIDAVTEPVLDAVIYRMTDFLGAGDYGNALLTLQKLLKMQEDPLGILGAIGGHFRRLSVAKILLSHGKTAGDLMRLYKIKEYPAQKAMQMCRKFETSFYTQAAYYILETDRMLKTSYDDSTRLLEMLILRLSQEARNG